LKLILYLAVTRGTILAIATDLRFSNKERVSRFTKLAMLLYLGEREEHLFSLNKDQDIVGTSVGRKEVAQQPPNISILYKKRYMS